MHRRVCLRGACLRVFLVICFWVNKLKSNRRLAIDLERGIRMGGASERGYMCSCVS